MRIIQSLKLFNPKSFRTVFTFCQNRDIAIVSSKIISMIQNQQKEDTKCLGLKISQLTVKDFPELYKIQPQNLDIVKQMFTKGVQLPHYYKNQERIVGALKAAQGKKNQPQSLFLFYPTWITTTHVFKYMRKKKLLCLFTGDRGVGKTSSFILYSMLMNNITKYVVKNKQAAKKLIQAEIIKSPEKVIYWSFQKQIPSGTIVDQCSQMFNDNVNPKEYQDLLKLQKNDLRHLSIKISDFYTLGGLVKTVIIIDQINALAALYRNHNAKKNNKKFKKMRQLSSLRQLQQLDAIRQHISSMGNYQIYNSSVNIEKSLFSKQHIIQLEENMILNPHAALDQPKLEYQLRINYEKAKKQTLHYIGMEYKRYFANFMESQIQEQMIKWNIPAVKASAKKSSENAQLALDNNQRQKLLNEKILIIQNFIKPYIQFALPLFFVRLNLDIGAKFQPIRFIDRIKEYYQIKSNQFKHFIQKIEKIDINEKRRITQILILLSNNVFQLEKQENVIEINRKTLFQQMKYMFPDINEEMKIDRYMDQSTFHYSNQIQGYICKIPRSIMGPMLQQFTVNYLLKDFEYCTKRLHINKELNGSVIGSLLEYYITKGIEQCGKQKGYFNMQKNQRRLVADGIFYQLNLPNGQIAELYLEGHMSQMIQMAKKNQEKFCLGLPHYKMQPQKRSYQSHFADFCLIKYTPNKKKPYEMLFVDIKTGNNLSFQKLNEKAKIFKSRLQLSLKSQNIEYDVQTIILCKKKCSNPQQFPELVVVDISKIEFVVPTSTLELIAVKELLQKLILI